MNNRAVTELVGRREIILVAILLALGLWLRLYALDEYPLGVHQDELSNIYDGYSILETGADRFGDRFPLQVRAFGENDYRPAMYAWMASVPIGLFGFSVTSGRLPSAILGFASLVLLYGFARKMGGMNFGVVVLLLGVLSPLHIQYSRVAHEGSMLPAFFLILALFLWQRAAIVRFPLAQAALLGLAVGVSANPYQSTRLTAPLLALVFVVDILRNATLKWRAAGGFAAAALIGALPQVLAMLTDPTHFFARARLLSTAGGEAAGPVWTFVRNFGLNLGPAYLFVPREIADLAVARLLPTEIMFFYVGLLVLAFIPEARVGRARWMVYAALVITLLPAVLTEDNPNTMRASAFAVLSPLFSAAGIVWLYGRISTHGKLRGLYYPVVGTVIVASAALLIFKYSQSVMFREAHFQNFLVLLNTRVGRYQKDYSHVFMERYGSQPYIYVVAFNGIKPAEFQSMTREFRSDGMDYFTRVGKFRLMSREEMAAAAWDTVVATGSRALFVSTVPLPGLTAIDSVMFQQEKAWLLIRPPS